MTATMKELGIDRMSVDDRLDLMNQIWDSIATEGGQRSLSDARRRELERRLAEHAADADDVVGWDQIKTEALARLER